MRTYLRRSLYSSGGKAAHPFDEQVLRSDFTLHPRNLSLSDLVHYLIALKSSLITTGLAKVLLGTAQILSCLANGRVIPLPSASSP
jgi:hypothetical protein